MASTSPPLSSIEQPPPAHKRTYQACIPCRRRKVRCDLGPVDNPHDPPCVRCRREKKDCFFTETRRKRKAEDEGARDLSEEYVERNRRSQFGRSSYHVDGAGGDERGDDAHLQYDFQPDGPEDEGQGEADRPVGMVPMNASVLSTQWDSSVKLDKLTPEGREVTNQTAAALFKSPIHNPGDALHLLVDAVARSGDLDRRSSQTQANLFQQDGDYIGTLSKPLGHNTRTQSALLAIDPAIAGTGTGPGHGAVEDGGMKDALLAWSRFRFVRAGWLTAREAISYINYFYDHLAPLTPISPPNYRSPSLHADLLTEEPMLCLTLLTIASRYMKLKGPAAQSRSFMIHDKLWIYLQSMITRMFWGQEQSGGGFCGAGATKIEPRSGTPKAGLRSLGSIESLLLLSDWHPRSMHFPPGDDGDEIIAPQPADLESSDSYASSAGWTEPALRSDKMCWSLVSFAYTLSYELGIFDTITNQGQWRPLLATETPYDSDRVNRVGRLLHIYVNQTCGRLGITNILPHDGTMIDVEYFKMTAQPALLNGMTKETRRIENVQRAWAGITALMRRSNADMFESKSMTRERIQRREYLGYLEVYWASLREWLKSFGSIEAAPLTRTHLLIEYEYARTYINSVSLQAVLEQCATASEESAMSGSGPSQTSSGHTPPALLSSKLVDLRKENEVYIAEVVDASRNMLRHVINGLVPYDGLRHAPVRTHFRILSGAMFLLKTFAVGAKEKDVANSVELLQDTVKALRKNVVDDVHLILRIADLLDRLTSSIRTKFVRLAVPGRNGNKRSPNHQRKPSSQSSAKSTKPLSPTIEKRVSNGNQALSTPNTSVDFSRTKLVDPNDSSVTIMPPPDYIYGNLYSSGDNKHLYSQSLSPQQPYPIHNMQGLPSSTQQQQQQSYLFPPTGQDYDWLTLDVNPILHQGQGSTGNNNNNIGSNAWAGAFGPEIGDSLEMLGMLANDGYNFGPGEGDLTGWS